MSALNVRSVVFYNLYVDGPPTHPGQCLWHRLPYATSRPELAYRRYLSFSVCMCYCLLTDVSLDQTVNKAQKLPLFGSLRYMTCVWWVPFALEPTYVMNKHLGALCPTRGLNDPLFEGQKWPKSVLHMLFDALFSIVQPTFAVFGGTVVVMDKDEWERFSAITTPPTPFNAPLASRSGALGTCEGRVTHGSTSGQK